MADLTVEDVKRALKDENVDHAIHVNEVRPLPEGGWRVDLVRRDK